MDSDGPGGRLQPQTGIETIESWIYIVLSVGIVVLLSTENIKNKSMIITTVNRVHSSCPDKTTKQMLSYRQNDLKILRNRETVVDQVNNEMEQLMENAEEKK